MAFQNFTVKNKSPVSVIVTEINFFTPNGIRHIADLGNFNGIPNFSGNTFFTSTEMTAGESKVLSIDYAYVSGDNGSRNGAVEIKTNANTSATIRTTIIVDTDIILVPTPVPTPIPVPLPIPVPVPVPLPTPISVPVGTSPPSLPPPIPAGCFINFSISPTNITRYISDVQPNPATGDITFTHQPTDPSITTGSHFVGYEIVLDGITKLRSQFVKVVPDASENKTVFVRSTWSRFFDTPGLYDVRMILLQRTTSADNITTSKQVCKKTLPVQVVNPTGVSAASGTWSLTTKKPEYVWGETAEFVFQYSKSTYPTELANNWFWIEFFSTIPSNVKVSQDFARGRQVRLENGKPIIMTRSIVDRWLVNESSEYDTAQVEAVVWTESVDDYNVFQWFDTQFTVNFKVVKQISNTSNTDSTVCKDTLINKRYGVTYGRVTFIYETTSGITPIVSNDSGVPSEDTILSIDDETGDERGDVAKIINNVMLTHAGRAALRKEVEFFYKFWPDFFYKKLYGFNGRAEFELQVEKYAKGYSIDNWSSGSLRGKKVVRSLDYCTALNEKLDKTLYTPYTIKDPLESEWGPTTVPPPAPTITTPEILEPQTVIADKTLTITPTTILAGGSYTVRVTGPGGSKIKYSLVLQPNSPSYDDEITLPNNGEYEVSPTNQPAGTYDLYVKFVDDTVLKKTLVVQESSASSGPGTIGGTSDSRELR